MLRYLAMIPRLNIRSALNTFFRDTPPYVVFWGKVFLGIIAIPVMLCVWLAYGVMQLGYMLLKSAHGLGERLVASWDAAINGPRNAR